MGDILRGEYGHPSMVPDPSDYEYPLSWWHVAVLFVAGVVLWMMAPVIRAVDGMSRGDRWH